MRCAARHRPLRPRRKSALGLLLAALAVPSTCGPSTGEMPPEPPPPTFAVAGHETFLWMFALNGVRLVSRERASGGIDLADAIVVLWDTDGDRIPSLANGRPCAGAWRRGAGVLVASNRPTSLDGMAAPEPDGSRPRAHIEGTRLPSADGRYAAGPASRLTPNPNSTSNDLFAPGPLSPKRVERLVALAPTVIEVPSYPVPFEEPILTFFGPSSRPGNDGTIVAQAPLAVAGSGKRHGHRYDVLALADSGILANGPLVLEARSDNRQFAWNVVRFLQGGGERKRSRCLFVVRGEIVEDYESVARVLRPRSELPPLPLPSGGQLLKLFADQANKAAATANREVEKIEDRDGFNGALLGERASRRSTRLAEIVGGGLATAAVCAVLYLLRKVWKARRGLDAPSGGVGFSRQSSDTVVGRRCEEMLRRNDLHEVARAAISAAFEATGMPLEPGPRPRIVFPDGRQRGLADAIEELWRIGYGPFPIPVPVARWEELEPRIEVVRRAAVAGEWRFESVLGEVV